MGADVRANRGQLDPEVRGYLQRRHDTVHEVVDTAPVFGKRYMAAADELDDLQDLLGIVER
jgi:hypothetical protein